MVALTGFITTYDGEPDTTKCYNDAAIKKDLKDPGQLNCGTAWYFTCYV